MDAVSVSVPAFPSLPSFNLGVAHTLLKPTTWIVVLATLVVLSSIRAALLYVRPPTWTEGRKRVSFVAIAKQESGSTSVGASSPASESRSQPGREKPSSKASEPAQTDSKKTSSWLWGLVKWDSLPAAPPRSERGGWQAPSTPQMQQTRRPGPAFDHPLPALYDTQVPASMAKMIMSRHTFRRPASRPPPVRATNVPQYQRRTPSMV
ncbi:hypothetical protein JR316_0007855 [Psilocybe cubensis]|uniref:Uncharacterized protein n=2 Tax=Psilocybe cubensis TaxID=181762 RepID=A0A8H7XSM4_PSICU|nr:hypothetical protein JR316_0007855 [Psilocybe cubensis]KAH9479267.1 hypothetical protein JR316_0007855 [Psilocybe cubensis]